MGLFFKKTTFLPAQSILLVLVGLQVTQRYFLSFLAKTVECHRSVVGFKVLDHTASASGLFLVQLLDPFYAADTHFKPKEYKSPEKKTGKDRLHVQ